MAKLNEDGNATTLIITITMLLFGAVMIFIIAPAMTDALTSQVMETPPNALAKADLDVTAAFETMVTIAKFTVLAVVAMTIIYMVRMAMPHNSNTYDEETPHHSSTQPQTVVSNTPHATIYVAGGGGGGGGGHTPQYFPIPDTPPVEYELPKPKKPVDRDGVEDDDSSFIEVLD